MMHALRKHSSILAKMKIFLPLVVWIILLFRTANSQISASRKHVGIFGLKHEVFFLNLEDGYFGCQVNESTDYLQLYELSKLCDGTSDCYMGSDELRNKLKCTNDCDKDGTACSNGVCLDGLCHCNDGFGGCNCQVPDENECKYRPCDVFAHCTNTLGSFTCTCFPGYHGDGLHCEDIDECQDPSIAQRCVENAECCNLPAHFVCKCKPGFEGDGEERCTDVNECLDPQACGLNAECVNLPGNYTCQCREGYYGDAYNGCIDIDECVQPGVCGPGAICTNVEGGYRCDCPQGFDGDARSAQGCVDYDECARSPCGRNALCRNEVGSFRCECQNGFSGDAMTDCQAACSETDECNQDEVCSNGQCVNPCHEANACGMNAECLMGAHAKQCSCPAGFTGDAAIECVRVPISCASNADCSDGSVCKESMCLPRCRNDQECALNEKCLQGSCMLTCRLDNDCFLGHICLSGRCVYGCKADSDCSASETCRDNRCINPCLDSPCGPNAACTVVNHRASCSCFAGMVPSPTAKVGCVRAPALQCTENRDCADGTSCMGGMCRPLCADDQGCLNNERCDGGACKPICRKDDDCRTGEICQGQTCMIGCRSDGGCPSNLACIGQQCTDPCGEPTACGTNAECVVVNHRKQCSCPVGLVGDPFGLGCRQETRLCQTRSDCPKGHACYSGSCMQTCRNDHNCLADERCVRGTCRTVCNSDASCGDGLICEGRICQPGCRSDNQCSNVQACINKKCTDPCATLGQCGACSDCKVIDHGVQCSCPAGYLGNPLLSCSPPVEKCHGQCTCDEDGMYCVKACRQQKDCGCGQTCQRGKCRAKCNPGNCPAGLLCQNGACVAGCRSNVDCPAERTCTNGKCADPCANGKACGKNALCQVSDHRSLCLCPDGYQGDPAVGCVQYECQTNDDCELDKKCSKGKCINPCLIPGACGLNAQCRVVDRQAQCSCTPGFFGNARQECQPVQKNSCAQNPCGDNTVCREDDGGFECSCQPGCVGDPRQGCVCGDKQQKTDCDQYACGTNAVCQMTEWGAPACVCLATHPYGDPYMACTQENTETDCRTTGCTEGECVRDGTKFICRKELGCRHSNECPPEKSCINGVCDNPCRSGNPCDADEECEVQNHEAVCVKLCQCEKTAHCGVGQICDGCNCIQKDTDRTTGCEHCPPGIPCDPITGGCVKEPPGSPKIPGPCQSDNDCLDAEVCYMGLCENPCLMNGVCAKSATCQAKMHRPVCTCPPGHEGNPTIKCSVLESIQCTKNDECSLTEACVGNVCQRPCDVKNPCTANAVCINANHGTDCSCIDGYHGNGFVQCVPVITPGSVCQYNEDCPPDKLCDRLNRVCINPCLADSCGDNAECYAVNHGIDCRCRAGFTGNAYIECTQHQGCLSDRQCQDDEACINGRCSSPCQCGPNAMCDVKRHKAVCRCPPGYAGDARIGCNPPSNPCDPNPCGVNAMCEIDNGSPVCFCPRGLTGNPFKNCIPEGDDCTPNPCGPNSGCRKINGKATCFCLPEYEGNPPQTACTLPTNPCVPSPCGPNTQCSVLSNGYAKCTCVPGYIESPNTIRGCVEPTSPCDPNPCGFGAVCDASRNPVCYCPGSMTGNPYRSCVEPVVTPELCQPGPCGPYADCYVAEGREQCYCKPGYIGDPYGGGGCVKQPGSVCEPNPCGPGAECVLLVDGTPGCRCPPGLSGDPVTTGCHAFECLNDDQCSDDKACIGLRCSDPCPGSCGGGAHCRVEKHHPVCFCDAGLTGNPAIQCYSMEEGPRDACKSNPCGANTKCTMRNRRPVCKCLPNYQGDPRKGCKPECDLNSDCTPDKSCVNHKCVAPCTLGTVCGVNAECSVQYHTTMCRCPTGYTGDPFVQCVPIPEERNTTRQPCSSDPCGPGEVCSIYGNDVALCDPCVAPDAIHNPRCRPQCVLNTDCPFNLACLQSQCQDPCPGSCGYGALCSVERHRPVCYCPPGMQGNPYEQCAPQESPRETCASIRCGANTQCKQQNGALACVCKKNYYGDPLVGCRPECVVNTDCALSKACVNTRCADPCVNACGVNAQCKVVNHLPICYCPPTHTGDALVACTERTPFLAPDDTPCDPNPCGPNSKCRTTPDGYAICSCLPGYRGVPPACQAECMINAECPQNRACINLKCADPCPGTCGVGARCEVLNHNPICSCGANQQGDPFVICEARLPGPPPPVAVDMDEGNPCEPSPCGPNSICQVRSRRPVCSCQPNFIGAPPNCRPECVLSSECPQDKACINERCQNPCANACGANADCHIVAHSAFCSCRAGFEGDAFIGCSAVPREVPKQDVCYPSPCAENAVCSEHNGAARCTCISPYRGDPYNTGCRPECVLNSDCPSQMACVNQHCRDPCPGVCGTNAECTVANHIPVCECSRGYVGDPFRGCRKDVPTPITPKDPCASCPSNSVCRIVGDRPTCSCPEGYRGAPPACRPECSSNEECAHDKSCINLKCTDPCPGLCGLNAQCQVINHKPFCSCLRGMIGNPFEQCYPKPTEPVHPCQPSPCGAYAECREIEERAVCTCAAGMLGTPPNCRPECETDQDCPSDRACFNQKCRDPCVGSCGYNAQCITRNHRPECYCVEGFEGDPYGGCNPIVAPIRDEPSNPCNPSPCGANAVCKERNGAGSCTCLPEYFGDPYGGCRPECVQNSDCPRVRACVNNRCQDPCPGVCGIDAECYVVNHSPSCSCRPGFTGDPFTQCRLEEQPKQPVPDPINPCRPSPCGPNSVCRETDGHAVCSCQAGFIGTPPSCRPECVVSSECALDKACVGQKCTDPCPGTCGQNARCQVVNHNPICSCSLGFTGDPFVRCVPVEKAPVVQDPVDPCLPSPCGPNSVCRAIGTTPACSCLPNYVGRAPNCRPECTLNAECPATQACVNERCTNPCVGSCGINARCTVVKHNPICECEAGFTGDPFSVCTEIPPIRDAEPINPCNPSPCGANAVCKERNGAGSCSCLPEYFGDPYTGCRPECVQNSDCERSRACVNNKCRDPCPGVCGLNAECAVQNHGPVCYCLEGYTGDPSSVCTLAEIVTERPKTPGCQPSPCGPNSQCREINGHPVCSCLAGYIGTPPMCRPECVVSSECSQDRACQNKKCVDPCPGTCGTDARCQVVNHNPICSCSPGFTGDPFIRCVKKEEPKEVTPAPNPCLPSPCGPNSNCRTVGDQPACSCAPNYIGRPPNCRPECTRDAECPSNLACQNERCVDPCAAGCGLNAVCRVINHLPVCTCEEGYEGNAREQCSRILPPTTERLRPCTPSPCGPNAECRERNNAGACYCLAGYEGNPYDVFSGCRRECDVNADCAEKLACVQYKCVDPCPGVCGSQAVCEINNHVPTCICPDGMIGDPFVQCELRLAEPVTPAPPVCDKFTCGPNSICRIQNGVAVCKCQPEMVGSPPNCRPECQQNSDCEAERACVNYKCIDPCPGACGQNANCNIINHNPICSCSPGFTGDPFTRCYKEVVPIATTETPRALCTPSPCGPNAECKVVGNREACSCLPGYIGAPPSCRPECILSTECPDNQACIRQKCTDPCPGSCGLNAKCSVVRHTPSCSCEAGYTGDPFTGCQLIIVNTPPPRPEPKDPCYPSPCGTNARCRLASGNGAVCECIENYFGNPYESCRPECVSNGDCQKSLACINNRCKDPCPGVCGRNAECGVVNHTPVCSCPDGMRGNAFEQCLREEVPPPPSDPCYPSPCGQNTVCRVSNGNAVCECLPEFRGSPFGRGCYPECVINSDCPRDRTCVNKKCVDPCPGVCGYRAVCHAINNSPVCSCPANMIGDPFVECKVAPPKDPCSPSPCRTNGICRVVGDRAECQYPECIINSDCSPARACYNQKCQDPCIGACGVNALCNVINHAPVCSCPARHVGSPFVQCMIQRDEQPPLQTPQPECTSDGQCTNDKACINGQCQNPCTVGTGLCTQNAECRVQFHRAICACREGYTGNAQLACYEIGCRSNSDCPATEACVNRNCVDPCQYTQCGTNAYCRTDYNHNARCHCTDGYRGNPLVRCDRPECTRDDECPYHQSCQNEQCRDPCSCAPNAQCRVDNHQASCRCPPGYTGDPQFSCEKIPVSDPPQCTMDADCTSKLACFGGVCKNPCLETKPCAERAICTVQDTLPLRTMYCVCEEGYVGDAERQCLPAAKDEPGCYSDVECASTQSCRAGVCVDVCSTYNPCARTAECLAQSHKAICSCPIGTVGDPFQNCYKPQVVAPECTVDADCSSSKACINERCQDPCAGANPCGGNAECRAVFHRPHCTCPIGWGGDPKTQCYKPECTVDPDCPFDKACFNGKCLSPCTYGGTQCGQGASCLAQSHRAVCICPPGTQGNPFVSCVTGMCQYNEDCADQEACDRLNRVCRPVCDEDTCARSAQCIARNHQASCECAPNTRGNPYVECVRDEVPEPECRMDSECRSQQACIRNRCVNPCTELTPCTSEQTCQVIDTLPLRTIICACKTDMLMDRSGSCRPIVVEECRTDDECPDTDRCVRGQCVTACREDRCGLNAQCTSGNHRAQCSCSPGYVGNPHIECLPEPRVITPKECAVDDDCAIDRACRNERCENPCAEDGCGRGALCRVENHRARCTCPVTFTMDVNGNCVPPTEDLPRCRSNSDCTRSETCVNELCTNPCNCGQNADCFVKDHYPVCSCRPGYSGNAQTGCFKLECVSDAECPNERQCSNGACVNPCLYQDPCAINAECYGDRHRAACRCLPGMEGDPFERCRRVECHYDGECSKSLACRREQCVDLCARDSPCARNAQCFMVNHEAQCKCPEHLPLGDPYSFCRPRPVEADEECRLDGDCPTRLACIGSKCVDPCRELKPCATTALCTVHDTVPVRTMVCECPPLHVPDSNGECRRVEMQTPVGACTSDSECSEQEACINRRCRDPCSCGTHATCLIKNHRAVCSCEEGFEGNPNVACRAIGCRVDSECESSKACVNGNCVNPCLDNDPCGLGAECYGRANRAECRCPSGYRGNPLVQCNVVECRSNNDCPDDKQCRNGQCGNPCIYDNPCAPRAECRTQNHLVVCRCPVGLVGNPYVDCRPELLPECRYDTDCPSHLACLEGKCGEPCAALAPCNQPARCEVLPSSPVRTMYCTCPDGYVSSGSGTCKPIVKAGCISDSDCSSDTACINSICRNPCNCGANAQCRVKDHKPVCSCQQGYDGDPETQCIRLECRSDDECSGQHTCYNRQCVPACSMETCGPQSECIAVNHRAVCECLPGYEGNPRTECKLIGCRRDTDCPLDKACINGRCDDLCERQAVCGQNEQCRMYQHRPECACLPPFENDPVQGCILRDERCMTDGECPSQTACIQADCVNPCNETLPCGVNSICKVLDTLPVRTMICECLPGYQGNAAIQCDKMALCPTDRGFVRNVNGECTCPPGYGLSQYDDCQPCREEDGLKIDETGRCVCALERGLIIDERGRCICPIESGYRLTSRGECIRTERPECEHDDQCDDWRYCDQRTKTCEDPCVGTVCGKNALCNATNHRAVCQCIAGYDGNPEVLCSQPPGHRILDSPPEVQVACLADGVQVSIGLTETSFNGVLYVKGHSKDEECRRVINGVEPNKSEIFKVHFGSCGLIHVNGVASFVLVVQKHPTLVTYKAQAFNIKCVYQTGEKNVTLGFNVQMLTTAGTIANTGPPPTCAMRIVAFNGEEINSAEIGDNLRLQVEVQPATIYGGFARSCVAKTMEESVENEYIVTDEDGCATDPSIFGDWEYNAETNSLLASFNAFKFPSSDNIRFQCNIRVCFGKCQPVNCHGANAYGKRRRRRREAITDETGYDRTIEFVYNRTKRASDDTALATEDPLGIEGSLREEITIQSNAILTLEKREERSYDSNNITPAAQRVEDICVSMIGLILALVITALLALVAVAVAVSCWLMAYRRRPTITGPLPHPPEFPNPLFAHHEPSEPSHHDFMG